MVHVLQLSATLCCLACTSTPIAHSHDASSQYPVKGEAFITTFRGSEGITFSREGRLFIGANNAIWIAEPSGKVRKIADVFRHLGQAPIGKRDILAADFGPTNAFQHGPHSDGIIWRITPEGRKSVFATGVGDPNALLQLPGGTWLVSDDAVDKIYRLVNGNAEVWSNAVQFPNGMALSKDGRTLYVSQIFSRIRPAVPDDRIWAIPISNDKPAGEARVVARTISAPDGLVPDERGRIYIADNGSGTIQRFDPESDETVVIAAGMPHIASLVFGQGAFDRRSIYATSTAQGGGTIWRIRVGVGGARQVVAR